MGLLLLSDDGAAVAIAGTASAQVSALAATVTQPVSAAVSGQATAQVSSIAVDVVAPPAPVDVAIAGVVSSQVTSIRSGYPHHMAPTTRTFVWRI
jgi:hypothetical protein